LRITFLILLLNSLFFTQVASAVSEEVKLKGALLKAMKTHDTQIVKAIANGGYESIDRDDVLQERIYEYLDAERQRAIAAKEKAKADALAKEEVKEKARVDTINAQKAAKEKAKTDAIAKEKAAAVAITAKKVAEEKKKKDAIAAKKRAKQNAAAKEKAKKDAIAKEQAHKKATADKKKRDAIAAKKAKEKKVQQAKAAEKKRKQAVAAKKKAPKKQVKAKKATPKKIATPKKVATPKVAPKIVVVPVAVAAAPLTVSDKKLVGRWKQVSSEKVITLVIKKDTSFSLEQVEDDGTLTILGTWKSEENIFMLSIKKVQRNVHTRDTDIHRIYKVERLSKHRLVLRDKRNRVAYDLKR